MNYKLKELRKRGKITSDFISKQLNISKAFYSQIENGKRRLTYDMAIKIANIFNMKPDEVFYNDHINNI